MSEEFDLGANYRVGDRIGAGASGVVYCGTHKGTAQRVAIKFLREQYRQDPQVVTRFVSERTLLTAVTHPGIVRVHDLVAEGGQLAIVMDYLPGCSLATYLREHAPLAPHLALTITSQILAALDHAHSHQLIHRDVKPDNIILTNPDDPEDPGVVITDFGIASILGASHSSMTGMVGTAAYMAPELIRDATIAPSIDLYAVGITCYQMLAATTPFDTDDEANAFTIANRHLTISPPRIEGLQPKTRQLLDTLLSKSPDRRASVKDITPILREALEETVGQAPLPALVVNPSRFHQATIVKPSLVDREGIAGNTEAFTPPALPTLPELPEARTATVLKPRPADSPADVAPAEEEPRIRAPWWKRPPILVAAAGIVIAIVAAATWFAWPTTSNTKESAANLQASLDEKVLPSGLKITRTASWDAQRRLIEYTVAYASIKTPIQGPVLETLTNTDGTCLQTQWVPSDPTITVTPHSLALTSIKANCGWAIALPKTDQTPISLSTTFTPEDAPNSQEDLQAWLAEQSEKTTQALNDPNTTSTAYPLQRLNSIRIETSPRITQGKPIPITVIGIWPNGENTLTPIYTSPSSSEPTTILKDITAADSSLVRLSDRCSGAISITPDGHNATALYPTNNCTIGAQVGNYETNQAPITITNNGS